MNTSPTQPEFIYELADNGDLSHPGFGAVRVGW